MKTLLRVIPYFWLHIKNYWWSFFGVFAAYGVGSVGISIIQPLIYRGIIDTVTTAPIQADVASPLFFFITALALLIVAYSATFRLGDFFLVRSQSNVKRELYNYAFESLQTHSYRFFANTFSGSIVSRVKRFVRAFEVMHDTAMLSFWMTAVQLTGTFVALFIVAPLISAGFLLWCVLYIILVIFIIRARIPRDLAEAEADSQVTGALADVITNILTVKMFSAAAREIKMFGEVTAREQKARDRAWYFQNIQWATQGVFVAILEIGGMYLTVRLWLAGEISTGTIVLVQAYFGSIFHSMWGLSQAFSRFSKALSEAAEMVVIFETPPDILNPVQPETIAITRGEVVFKDVTFSYGRQPILKNFSLTIRAGERVGLVGYSGAGKTTITKLLLRFSDIEAGVITIDGQDIRALRQDDLRSIISYVPQDSILFHRSLRDNIAYGRPSASEEEVITAAKKAHAHEFVSAFPDGYNTLVGERGVKLSGGERQRIAIARAMLKHAPLLMLDEATSSLDSVSEKYIQEAFEELMKQRTTIVIAHRLSTIQRMDRIIVLEKGTIADEGTHAKLLEKKGAYHALWTHQIGGFIE